MRGQSKKAQREPENNEKSSAEITNKKPKGVPHTLDTLRERDATTVLAEDEEVLQDEETDELSPYFSRDSTPKLLVTTSDKARKRTIALAREIASVIPNAEYRSRRRFALKKIIPECVQHGVTDLMVINENRNLPDALTLCHLPNGPTAVFKLRSVKLMKEIKNVGEMTEHWPEVITTNFTTRLGHGVARMFSALFPHDPNFHGRRAVTFHNQRDFIFFRNHRYIFRNSGRAGLQELGPKFTLKLRALQKGTFDSEQGEYIWIHKQLEMNKSKRKFFL
ncbi:ribosome production factor 1-like [Paramacrobiotus metropolitanus]|uniref:ribosome production factor 1-like n=1 Tax=Paramacrobiotus metropolitanus TaxID=2943436 RepID=UPI00244621C1|nr:ribosome production factor 1-like [Paramacrobiotus metropolitanus]